MNNEALFWTKVDAEDGAACWKWKGPLSRLGYAKFWSRYGGRHKSWLAHRLAYEWCVGPIPEKMTLDHLCRVRHCVNPAHLEPVTHRENVLRGEGVAAKQARQTHCVRGHELSGDNVRYWKRKRYCRACRAG